MQNKWWQYHICHEAWSLIKSLWKSSVNALLQPRTCDEYYSSTHELQYVAVSTTKPWPKWCRDYNHLKDEQLRNAGELQEAEGWKFRSLPALLYTFPGAMEEPRGALTPSIHSTEKLKPPSVMQRLKRRKMPWPRKQEENHILTQGNALRAVLAAQTNRSSQSNIPWIHTLGTAQQQRSLVLWERCFHLKELFQNPNHNTMHPMQPSSPGRLQSFLLSVRLKIPTFCCVINQVSALCPTSSTSAICSVTKENIISTWIISDRILVNLAWTQHARAAPSQSVQFHPTFRARYPQTPSLKQRNRHFMEKLRTTFAALQKRSHYAQIFGTRSSVPLRWGHPGHQTARVSGGHKAFHPKLLHVCGNARTAQELHSCGLVGSPPSPVANDSRRGCNSGWVHCSLRAAHEDGFIWVSSVL